MMAGEASQLLCGIGGSPGRAHRAKSLRCSGAHLSCLRCVSTSHLSHLFAHQAGRRFCSTGGAHGGGLGRHAAAVECARRWAKEVAGQCAVVLAACLGLLCVAAELHCQLAMPCRCPKVGAGTKHHNRGRVASMHIREERTMATAQDGEQSQGARLLGWPGG